MGENTRPLYGLGNNHPHHTPNQGGGSVVEKDCYGGHSQGETPGPIPNPEAKPLSADGTAHGSVWESRTPPDTNHTNRVGRPTRTPHPVCISRTLAQHVALPEFLTSPAAILHDPEANPGR